MKEFSFNSLCLQLHYYSNAYTGDGFKVRIRGARFGFIFRIYWGPYKNSRHIIFFIGFDTVKFHERKIAKLMQNLTLQKRLAISKALLELNNETPNPASPQPADSADGISKCPVHKIGLTPVQICEECVEIVPRR